MKLSNTPFKRIVLLLMAVTMMLTAADAAVQTSKRRVRKKVVTPEQQAAQRQQEQEQERERIENTTIVEEYVTTSEIQAEGTYYEESATAVTEETVETVDQMPEFADGGETGLLRWLSHHVKYPAKAAQNNISGKVMVRFLVRSDGSVTDVEVVHGVHPSLDNEAQRVCGELPRFKPAMLDGRPVAYHYVVPVTFKIQY